MTRRPLDAAPVPGAAFVARLARGTALAAFGLIVLGAIVRATGSGLACPDWPLCHGRVIPPLQVQVLLEWGHRFVALMVSLGTLAIAGFVFTRAPLRRALGGLVAAALVLLAMQIVLGALTVWKLLQFGVVTWHLGNALLFLAALIALAERAAQLADDSGKGGPEKGGPGEGVPGEASAVWGPRIGLASATLATLFQVLLGGLVSTQHAGLACPDFPGCHGVLLPPLEGLAGLQMIHRYGAWLLTVLLVGVAFGAQSAHDPRVRATAAALPALVLLQIVLGVFNVLLAIPVWITAAHLATGTLLYALLVLATLRAFGPESGGPLPAGEAR
jgi:cytochrome c oxidase assembly protein subunit 15